MESLIRRCKKDQVSEHRDPAWMIEAIREAPHASALLRHFVEMALGATATLRASSAAVM